MKKRKEILYENLEKKYYLSLLFKQKFYFLCIIKYFYLWIVYIGTFLIQIFSEKKKAKLFDYNFIIVLNKL